MTGPYPKSTDATMRTMTAEDFAARDAPLPAPHPHADGMPHPWVPGRRAPGDDGFAVFGARTRMG